MLEAFDGKEVMSTSAQPSLGKATITIDKKTYNSPNPTIGVALYELGGINHEKYNLWRETHGHGDDELINYDKAQIKLRSGDIFFSAKKKLNPGGKTYGFNS